MYIGNKKILISETLLVPDGEVAKVSTEIAEDDILNLEMRFVNDEKIEAKNNFTVDFVDNVFRFTFTNFNASTGVVNNTPISFALSNKREPITLFSIVQTLGTVVKIEIQVMLEEANGQSN